LRPQQVGKLLQWGRESENTDISRTFCTKMQQRLFRDLRKYFVFFVSLKQMARPERLELPTLWFEARRSIQLSYGRTLHRLLSIVYRSSFFDFNLESLCVSASGDLREFLCVQVIPLIRNELTQTIFTFDCLAQCLMLTQTNFIR
jgi:hypothetical protein